MTNPTSIEVRLIADHVEWLQSYTYTDICKCTLSFITSEPCKIKVLWMVYVLFRAQNNGVHNTLVTQQCVPFLHSTQTQSQLQTAYNSIYRRYKTITLDIYQLQYGQQTMRFRAFVHCKTYLDQSTAMASEAPPLSSMLIFSSAIALSSSAILFCSSSIEICNSSTCRRYKHMNRYSQTNLLCTRLN